MQIRVAPQHFLPPRLDSRCLARYKFKWTPLVQSRVLMFKVSRKSEYALIAVQHLARHGQNGVISVNELSQAENISVALIFIILRA